MLILAATIIARCSALWTTSIDADEGVYLVMAQQWLHGGLPYIAVWDQHPPGLPALLVVVLSLISDPILGARLAAAAAVLATALLIHRFCLRYKKNGVLGLIAALLYIICISRWAGLSANTEIFNNACVTFAAYNLFGAASRPPGLPKGFMAALALGIGLQIKYVIVPEALLLSLGYLVASFRRDGDLRNTAIAAGSLIAGGILPTILVLGYFWQEGALRAFLAANIGSNITYVSLLPSFRDVALDSMSGMWPVAGALPVIFWASLRCVQWRPHWAPVVSVETWILLWIIAAILDVCLPMKFFRHYFFALYPPLCLGGAIAVDAIAAGRRKPFIIGLAVLFATAVPAWAAGVVRAAPWSNQDVPRRIAKIVREADAHDGDLYVYRYQPSVYALARIRPPTPYVMTLELSEFSQSAHVNGAKEMRRIMASLPRFVVKPAGTLGGPAAAVDQILTHSLMRYKLIRTLVDDADHSTIEIYERASGSGS